MKNGAKIKRVIYFENPDPTDRHEPKEDGFYTFDQLLNKGDSKLSILFFYKAKV